MDGESFAVRFVSPRNIEFLVALKHCDKLFQESGKTGKWERKTESERVCLVICGEHCHVNN